MDPIVRPPSLFGSACQALIATVHQVSADVTNFVRRCRSARTDLAPVMRELSELQMVLQLLNDLDAQRGGAVVPEELQVHLRPIVSNCVGVVSKVHEVLQRQEVAGWTVEARDEVGELAKSLSVQRGVMGVVSDLISILVSRKAGDSDGGGGEERSQITALLEELRALGSSLVISYSNATLAREHFALQVHLGQIVTYTETLTKTDPWQDAVRTLDEARQIDSLGQQSDMRRSTPLSAPLGHGHSADRDVAAAEMRNGGLDNLLQLGTPERHDHDRPPSMLFTPHRAPDAKSPATIESAGPSGTGFIVMDGFINSAQGGGATSSTVPYYGGLEESSTRHLTGLAASEPNPSRRSYEQGNSAELSVTRPIAARDLQPSSSPGIRASASGLQLQISTEKEVADEEVVSDEALAFAQVPIHVLDRLSVNLVGHVYRGSPSVAEDKASSSQSHATTQISQDEGAWNRHDAASTSTSDTGGLREGPLQFSQIDVSKVPAIAAASASHLHPNPNSNPQPTSRSQTPLGHHQQQQQLLPASLPLSQSSCDPASQAPSQSADKSTAITSSIPSLHTPNSSLHLPPSSTNGYAPSDGHSGLHETKSSSTMKTTNTQSYMSQKPLPMAPLVYIPAYPGPFIKKKVVVVGNFSCGKTCLIT